MIGGGVESRGGNALVRGKEGSWWMGRAEIDTSAPFESVREAVDHFGGSGHWRPRNGGGQRPCGSETSQPEINVATLEEETTQLQTALMVKERETLEVLKELEMAKKTMDGLKLRLRKEETSNLVIPTTQNVDYMKVHPIIDNAHEAKKTEVLSPVTCTKPSPSLILMELRQAKLNLNRTTSDLAGFCLSIESLKRELHEEKMSLAKTHERVSSSSTLVLNLEKELGQTRLVLQLIKDSGSTSKNPPDISRKLHELRSESEQFKRIAEGAKTEALKLRGDIEQIRAGIKTAEVRLCAAQKMEVAARAGESSAVAGINALTISGSSPTSLQNSVGVTLSVEEYNMLVRRAQDAEEIFRKRTEAAAAQVEEATKSKMVLLKKVDEVKAEVRASKKVLAEALLRVEVANKGKLAVEEALRKWRSENNQRRRSIYSSPRFKNSFPGHLRRESKTRELNVLGLGPKSSENTSKTNTYLPTLSIGQILSRKLVGPEDYENANKGRESTSARPKVSLGQMLNRRQGISSPETSIDGVAPQTQGQFPPKKKRFSLARFAFILAKHKKKNKNRSKRKKKKLTCGPK